MTLPTADRRIMRSKEVLAITGYSDMHLRRLESQGKFPRRFKISSEAKSAPNGWWSDLVYAWRDSRDQPKTEAA